MQACRENICHEMKRMQEEAESGDDFVEHVMKKNSKQSAKNCTKKIVTLWRLLHYFNTIYRNMRVHIINKITWYMFYTALISSRHCNNEANTEKLRIINIHSNCVFLLFFESLPWHSKRETNSTKIHEARRSSVFFEFRRICIFIESILVNRTRVCSARY